MPRPRQILILALVLGVFALPVWAQNDAKVAELEGKIAALEKRMATLERNIVQQLQNMERRIAQGATAPNPLEGEANAAYNKIVQLTNGGDMVTAKAEMTEFMKKYASTETAKRARRLNTELQVVGKSSPTDWGIEKWFQGESDVDLSSDKTTLLVFWEVWCPHCKREVPKIQKIYTDLKDEGLQLVGLTKITKSSTEEKVKEFITSEKLAYPMAKENGATSAHFNVSGIPAAAVVKAGKVVWRGHPARLNEAMLRDWL